MITLFHHDGYAVVRIRTDVPASDASIHLAILLDVSDSMSGERLDSVKKTLCAARTQFRPTDRVTLIVFGETAKIIVANHRMDDVGTSLLYSEIDALQTAGSTNMSEGLALLNSVQSTEFPYDSVIILTDGIINKGVTGTAGLSKMALSIRENLPFNTLGYGSDHNRTLLRILATKSCGTYTYISSTEMLPCAIGDIMAGARSEVFRGIRMRLTPGWKSEELGGHTICALGGILPGRDYWAVFYKMGAIPSRVYLDGFARDGSPISIQQSQIAEGGAEIKEQILRARVAVALANASDKLEQGFIGRAQQELNQLKEELENLPAEFHTRPLILFMKGQIDDVLQCEYASSDILARVSSGAAGMTTQRVVSTMDDPTQLFTSPVGRYASARVHTQYHEL